MRLSIIAAVADNRVIGRDNDLPWRLSADLKRFKTLTMGHHLLMGRKTFASLGRALPGRTMVVISRGQKSSGSSWSCRAANAVPAARRTRPAARTASRIGGSGLKAARMFIGGRSPGYGII